MIRRAVAALLIALAIGVAVVAVSPGLLADDYDRTTVAIADGETNEALATVDVRIADTQSQRYTGLSDTESLAEDEGMLFVHDDPGEYAYVMRDMAFAIDIVFVDADGTITSIHEAHPDDDGRFEGHGQYVLELRLGYAADHGIEEGDRVFEDGDDVVSDF